MRNKYLSMFRIHILESYQYFLDMVLSGAVNVIYSVTLFYLWSAIHAMTPVGEFTLVALVWYLTLAQVIRALGGRPVKDISESIQNGTIVTFMNKPIDYLWLQASIQFGKNAARALVALVASIIVIGSLAGFPDIALRHAPFIILVIIAGSLINFLLGFCIATSAFWVEDAHPIHWVYDKTVFILGGFLFPLDLLPGTIQQVASSLPTAYFIYHPAKLAVMFDWSSFVKIVLVQALFIGVLIALASWLLRRGTKRLSINGG